jgi:hypothetical protein
MHQTFQKFIPSKLPLTLKLTLKLVMRSFSGAGLILLSSLPLQAQTDLDSSAFNEHFQKRLTELHFRLIDGSLRNDVSLYVNDSLQSTYQREEIEDRLEGRYIEHKDNHIKPEYLTRDKDPGILFAYSLNNDFSSNQLRVDLVALAPALDVVIAAKYYGQQAFVWYTTDDASKVLDNQDFNVLRAMQMTIRNEQLFNTHVDNTSRSDILNIQLGTEYWHELLRSRIDSSQISYIAQRMEQALNHSLYRYIHDEKWRGKPFYTSGGLQIQPQEDEMHFSYLFSVQVQNDSPDEDVGLIDTFVRVESNLHDNSAEFAVIFKNDYPVLRVDMKEAKNSKGLSKFYIPFSSFKSVLTEWDYVLLMDFINSNRPK